MYNGRGAFARDGKNNGKMWGWRSSGETGLKRKVVVGERGSKIRCKLAQ